MRNAMVFLSIGFSGMSALVRKLAGSVRLYQLWLLFFVLSFAALRFFYLGRSIPLRLGGDANTGERHWHLMAWLSVSAALAVEGAIFARVLSRLRSAPVPTLPFLVLFAAIGLCGTNIFAYWLGLGKVILYAIPPFTGWLLFKSLSKPRSRRDTVSK